MLRSPLAPAVVCLLAALPLAAAEAPPPAEPAPLADLPAPLGDLFRTAQGDPTAYELVRSLTTEVGPRLAGSEGDRRAVAWALRELRRLGFADVRAEEVEVPRWERGEAEVAILAPWPQDLYATALGGSVGTPETGLVAEVVRVPSLEALADVPPDAVAGKIVFFDEPMERTKTGLGYGVVVDSRTQGPARAAEKGAVGVVIRSAGTGNHRFPHTGGTRYAEGVPRIPAAALAVPDADLLAGQLASGQPVRLRLRLTARDLGTAMSANVIGEIPGGERRDEIVVLACHLDSWDLGTGAVDDAAGCGVAIGAAKAIRDAGLQPARTLRVVLYANEEFGLSGARAYAAAHADELAAHYAATEADFGAGRVWGGGTLVSPEATGFLTAWDGLLRGLGLEPTGNTARGGADLIPLVAAGVPGFDLFEDGTDYFDVHHTIDDTLDKVDPADLAFNVAAHAVVTWLVAQSDADLRPIPSDGGED